MPLDLSVAARIILANKAVGRWRRALRSGLILMNEVIGMRGRAQKANASEKWTREEQAGATGASYSVGALARLSGASPRALRYYEEIGLLKPRRKPNGYRAYSPDDVHTLQQILLFRSCGVGLDEIRSMIMSPDFDACAALYRHLEDLSRRKTDLETLIATVEKTIASMEGRCDMTDKERFEGLKRKAIEDNERAYGREARERYGDDVVDAANRKLLAMDEGEWTDVQALGEAIIEQLKAAMAAGDVRGVQAQELARMHAAWIKAHWPEGAYSREAHLALAEGYVADERFTAFYDGAAGAGATQFLRDALVANL